MALGASRFLPTGPSTPHQGESCAGLPSHLPVVLQEADLRTVCFLERALWVLVPIDVVHSVGFVVIPVGQEHAAVFG